MICGPITPDIRMDCDDTTHLEIVPFTPPKFYATIAGHPNPSRIRFARVAGSFVGRVWMNGKRLGTVKRIGDGHLIIRLTSDNKYSNGQIVTAVLCRGI